MPSESNGQFSRSSFLVPAATTSRHTLAPSAGRHRCPVSVVIPTYNRASLLGRALSSVLAQTLRPLEIIVVDDGSRDGTDELIRSQFPEVRYLRQDNRGVSAARNLGIEAAGCDWIALLDSDDEWLPGKLEAQMRRLLLQPAFRVCHSEEIWIRRGVRVNPMKKHAKAGGWIFRRCLPLCAMSPSSILIHHEVFGAVGRFDDSLPVCEDYDLWLRITARYPVLFVEQPLIVKYGGHEDQLSRRYAALDRYRIRALQKILAEGDLSDTDRRAAALTLADKARIYAEGARKRGREQEAERYAALGARYAASG